MKNIIVSGCARGIGEAVARKLLQEGYCVTGMSRTDKEQVVAAYDSPNFAYVQGDLGNREDREALVQCALTQFGRIDGLVNVAGVAPKVRNDLLQMTEESYDFVMNINTKGTMFLTQAVAKEMLKNASENGIKGHICNISSISAYTSSVNRGEYCISKAGVSMLTKLFADRLAEEGIMVNEILPGIIATGMTEKVKGKYDALIDGGLLPIKRWGQP
ncbi:MAG: SDR family NAD(P)-dependent oxidoreductase, partial [Lachnospiraceae bacterium]|nr:SDR family NAD(P)-dependent oxidoreductase [Lachnospiraceae bacterium]